MVTELPPAPPRTPGERLRRAGVAAWSIIGIGICIVAFVWLMYEIRVIFPPLGLALLIVYVLNPVVSWLERRRVPRSVGAVGSYIVILGGITLLVIALIPFLQNQIEELREEWPRDRAEIIEIVQDSAEGIDDTFGTDIDTSQVTCLFGADQADDPDASTAICDQVIADFRDGVVAQAGRLTEIGSSALHLLLIFIIGPLVALYALIDLPLLKRDFINAVPQSHREEITDLGSKLGRSVGGFFRGQLLVALIVGVMSSIGFKLIGLPFWLVVGSIAGFTNLIPLVGPFIGGGLGVIIGIVTGGAGLALRAALVALAVQQIDNHVISPHVMKRTVNLHPGTVMLALLAGGTLAGFWGVLLAVPGVAVGKILIGHIWATRVLGSEVAPNSLRSRQADETEAGAEVKVAAAEERLEEDPPPKE